MQFHTYADSNGTFQWRRDNWAVFNYPLYFDYAYPYRECMTDEHLEALRNNLNHVEYRLMEPMLDWEKFLGAYYGFAATSLLVCHDILNPDEHYEKYNFTKDQIPLTEDGYLLTASQLDAVQITAKSDTGRKMLDVAADTNTMLFHEIDTHHLAAVIDKDGNGSYETVIAEATHLGDLNADGTANRSDAAQLLISAASIGAGNASCLTENQEKAADLNVDGSINASDSAIILQFAAVIGAGSFDGNLELCV